MLEWPLTHHTVCTSDPPASIPEVLELQVCAVPLHLGSTGDRAQDLAHAKPAFYQLHSMPRLWQKALK